MSPQQVLLIGSIVAPVLFALCAYFTRAGARRTAGGLVGVIAYSAVQYAWDRAAAVAGWWSYPAYGTSGGMPMPAPVYLFSGLVYAGFGLVGWRIARRYGWKGMLAFLAAWSVWGLSLDVGGSTLFSSSRFMVIGPGAAPRIADFMVYATSMAAVLLAIRVIGGPFGADPLARGEQSASK